MEFLQAFPSAIEKEGFRVVSGVSYADVQRHGLRFEPAAGGRRYLVDCVTEGSER